MVRSLADRTFQLRNDELENVGLDPALDDSGATDPTTGDTTVEVVFESELGDETSYAADSVGSDAGGDAFADALGPTLGFTPTVDVSRPEVVFS